MNEYTLSKINKLGEHDPKYGQRWWGEVNEDLKPVSFNVMEGEFEAGDKISFEVSENRRSTKGIDFLQLKKVKKVGSILEQPSNGPKTAQTSLSDGFNAEDRAQLQRIEDGINQLLGL